MLIHINQLQRVIKANSINGNKKAAIESCFDVRYKTGSLARTDTDKRILPFIIVSNQPISNPLYTAVDLAVSIGDSYAF